MDTQNPPMNGADLGMFWGGMALFAVTLALLVYCVVKRRPYKAIIALFPVAIVMIGFSQIKQVKIPGLELDKINDLANDPTPTTLSNATPQLNTLLFTNKNVILPPAAKSNLTIALNKLEQHPNLTPESRVGMVKLQLLLGQTNAATTNLEYALKMNPKLVINPELRTLTRIR